MQIALSNFGIILTPDETLRQARHDADEVEALLTAGPESHHIRVVLYNDGTYAAETIIIEGKGRDEDMEARLQSAIDDKLDREKRSSEE